MRVRLSEVVLALVALVLVGLFVVSACSPEPPVSGVVRVDADECVFLDGDLYRGGACP